MELQFSNNIRKSEVFLSVQKFLQNEGFKILNSDQERPWGGFFVIDESQSKFFIERFFPFLNIDLMQIEKRLSPKILLVEPGKRLSWQYHHRRSEVWTVLNDKVGIVLSDSDTEKNIATYKKGDIIEIKQGERHRLIGLESWGIIAEIWQHGDKNFPTDENDIVRLQDDYGR